MLHLPLREQLPGQAKQGLPVNALHEEGVSVFIHPLRAADQRPCIDGARLWLRLRAVSPAPRAIPPLRQRSTLMDWTKAERSLQLRGRHCPHSAARWGAGMASRLSRTLAAPRRCRLDCTALRRAATERATAASQTAHKPQESVSLPG
eukprot:scaffold118770_cov27-Tisochrysis_lutea.AAC.2